MSTRIKRLRGELDGEAFLVLNPVSVRYLTGFSSTNAALLIEPERVRLFTDFRYAEGAREVRGVETVETRRNLLADLVERLSGRIGFEADYLTYAGYETLAAGALELVPRRHLVEALRAVKDEEELVAIRRAAAIGDEVFGRLASEQFTGRSERELGWQIETIAHELGADAVSFPVTVASGPNGARPHTDLTERTIEPGETVVVDLGCMVDGYCSDCTRTFATGPLPDELEEAFRVCRQAQEQALHAVRAGTTGVEADSVARDLITEAGFGDDFGHGLGHGVGLLVHEAPRLSQESSDRLEPGNVVTVEPGIYLKGRGGVRIEDLVVVRDGAPEVLTPFTKDLVTVA
jgi:Xaa-Pro aminopeptidase